MVDDKIIEHPMRKNIVAEMHARPYTALKTPRTILRHAYLCTSITSSTKDMMKFANWCKQNNLIAPLDEARHHSVKIDNMQLTWERHSEFLTLTLDCPHAKNSQDNLFEALSNLSNKIVGASMQLIVAVSLDLVGADKKDDLNIFNFNKDSLCVSHVEDDSAIIITDFRQDLNGSTKFAVQNHNMNDAVAGVLVRRLLEIETYRCMALLGFEETKLIYPDIAEIENKLVELTREFGQQSDLQATRSTLEQISDISSNLVKLSAANQYRLSATRAYHELVNARLKRLAEQPIAGYIKIEEFIARRLGPAMRTCINMQNRLNIAENKLSRATELLRTKIDIQMQSQNHQLLGSMNKRAQMQYRLQSTVEGLSIAAVSYYVVGLLSYILKGFDLNGFVSPTQAQALAVPIVVLFVWFIISRIKAKHDST